jgi:hypothetical protein
MSETLLDDLANECRSDEAAEHEQRKAALQEYETILADPDSHEDASRRLRTLGKELGLSANVVIQHAEAFGQWHKAKASAPNPDELEALVNARCQAEKAVIAFDKDVIRQQRDVRSKCSAARGYENVARQAIGTARELERQARALLQKL